MSVASEEEFEVEKILGKRKRQGGIEYLIKWAGYDDEQNTWEPEENLDCADRIREFEEKHAADIKLQKEKKSRNRKKSRDSAKEKRRKSSRRNKDKDKPQEPLENVEEEKPSHEPKIPPIRIVGLKRKREETAEEALQAEMIFSRGSSFPIDSIFRNQEIILASISMIEPSQRVESNFVDSRKGELAEERPDPQDTPGQLLVAEYRRSNPGKLEQLAFEDDDVDEANDEPEAADENEEKVEDEESVDPNFLKKERQTKKAPLIDPAHPDIKWEKPWEDEALEAMHIQNSDDESQDGPQTDQIAETNEKKKAAKEEDEEVVGDEKKEDDPWADLEKVGFNRGFEAVKIHECVADNDGQIYFAIEWKDSKIIDFVKSEDCRKNCPKLVCEFYEELMVEMIHEWDGIFDIDSEPEYEYEKEADFNEDPSVSIPGLQRGTTGITEAPSPLEESLSNLGINGGESQENDASSAMEQDLPTVIENKEGSLEGPPIIDDLLPSLDEIPEAT
ncbi:Oidioi.mRNA.OKI2018_I69.XSR.g14993.t1.cds [Oikopleura dioica]|uniref:Oidioi.mRNA.OKI2018_I69.XSR.g14993.t1.cds n=1 Tax=Oikopleura dioica TaxID=34765 RepID=A0ABN7SGH1_OIKDI|nr:Oidioi.mRNA.OKI2018_I69.XSR.g14993.t1.cds [Oikopleura dioica]